MSSQLETVVAELLLRILPNPIIWGLVFVILLAGLLAWRRIPASASALLFSLPVTILFGMLGGVFFLIYLAVFFASAVLIMRAIGWLGRS